jgi:hypothetical protein
MRKYSRNKSVIICAVMLSLLVFGHIEPAGAGIKSGMSYADGRLTIEADQVPLFQLLEVIAKSAGIDIFISKGFMPGSASLKVAHEPLEVALKSLLHGYNYAVIYSKEGDEFRIAALKIYTEGQQGGEVVPLFTGGRTAVFTEKAARGETRTVMVISGGDVITHGNLEKRRGALYPSQTEIDPVAAQTGSLQSPWFAVKIQLEQQESDKFKEMQMLQKQMESTTDLDRKKALTLICADEMTKFYAMKKANINKIEALRRITQFKEMTGR